jgi:hypothetical protein
MTLVNLTIQILAQSSVHEFLKLINNKNDNEIVHASHPGG